MAATEPVTAPPPLPPARLRLPTPPRLLAVGVLSLGAFATAWLWFHDPEAGGTWFLPCLWHVATGTHCPGCGITRALHDLLHGRLLEALDHNAVGLLVFIATASVLARPAWIALRHDRWAPPVLPRRTALWLVIGGVLWAVLRNLPWAPFTLLAP